MEVATDVRDASRVISTPAFVVARIPIVLHAPFAVSVEHRLRHRWTGEEPLDLPLDLHFTVGEISTGDLRRIEWDRQGDASFALDAAGELALHIASDDGDRLLLTRRPGYEYELRVDRVESIAPQQWLWPRDVFRHALVSRRRGVLVHASGFCFGDGRGILCPGISGTGKSTLARLVASHHGATVLSDERVALTNESNGLRIWGTPWYSSAELSADHSAPLSAVLFIRHGGATPTLNQISGPIALQRLLRTFALPVWNARLMEFAFDLLERVIARVPLLEISYAPSREIGCWLETNLQNALS